MRRRRAAASTAAPPDGRAPDGAQDRDRAGSGRRPSWTAPGTPPAGRKGERPSTRGAALRNQVRRAGVPTDPPIMARRGSAEQEHGGGGSTRLDFTGEMVGVRGFEPPAP